MGANTKIIKRRIKSVGNTKKITKAMEMVAAAKMRKAVAAALNTRTYATMAWDLLVHLSQTEKTTLSLLETRPVKKLLLILFTSNRGLCGSFNSNIIKKTAVQLLNPENISRHRVKDGMKDGMIESNKDVQIDVVGVGKKGAEFAKKMDYNLIASFVDFSDAPTFSDVLPVCQLAIAEYEKKNYDKVVVAYTDYKSAVTQIAKLRQVLPVSEFDLEKMMSVDGERGKGKGEKDGEVATDLNEYLFEPNKTSVLKIILPRLVETQVFQSALESAASEHSARMFAMRNASDSAKEMLSELNLNYNKARQASITQEIAEIAGGAAALG